MNIASGPRGRRFLYQLLAASGEEGEALSAAMWEMDIRLAKDDGSRAILIFEPRRPTIGHRLRRLVHGVRQSMPSWRQDPVVRPVPSWKQNVPPGRSLVTSAGIARLISAIDLKPTREGVQRALADSVAFAMYWQEPDGVDRILSDPPIAQTLSAIDTHPLLALLDAQSTELFAVRWRHPGAPEPGDLDSVLSEWLEGVKNSVTRAEQERPSDPAAPWSGTWWSTPPRQVYSSGGMTAAGVPAMLSYVEDGPPVYEADVRRLEVLDPRLFTVGSAHDWAWLCEQYPLDVTAEVRHDWYRVTGQDGPWMIPNWYSVAQEWDGVHLTAAAYLTAAGTAIPVGDSASVIAGWNPGETFWLTDQVTVLSSEHWVYSQDEMEWRRG